MEGTFSNLYRGQSQKKMTLLCALLGIAAAAQNIPTFFSDLLRLFFRGTIPTQHWVEQLSDVALTVNPGASYAELRGFKAALFDNLTLQISYTGLDTQDQRGIRQDLTNWMMLTMPAKAAPAGFNPDYKGVPLLCAAETQHTHTCMIAFDCMLCCIAERADMFVSNVTLDDFADQFEIFSRSVSHLRRARWTKYLQLTDSMQLFARAKPTDVGWRPHFTVQPPMWDRGQNSEEDVIFELAEIFKQAIAEDPATKVLFAGGDGLTTDKLNYQLQTDADKWDADAYLIPMLGEAPHGLWHFGHMNHRRFRPLLVKIAEKLNFTAFRWEPTIHKDMNTEEWLIMISTRAIAEWVIDFCKTQGAVPYSNSVAFFREIEHNLDTAWCVHFLYSFGFAYLQFKQSVRCNDSDTLDLLWMEFLWGGRDVEANKTKYGPMAIMRVYYSQLLEPGLRRIFKFVRCLPCDGGMCTGWDMPCEWLNDDVKSHVKGATISRSRVEKFCERYNFWRVVLNGLKRLLYSERAARKQYMKDMDKDVKLIKEWLNEEIGSDWSVVTLGSCESQLQPQTVSCSKLHCTPTELPEGRVQLHATLRCVQT